MAESKFLKEKVGDEVSGKQTFAVSGKRLEKLCQPCSNADMRTSAEYWCLNCLEYFCWDCSKTHTRFTFARDHKIVAADEADEFGVSYDMKGLDQCKEHNKILEFVCEDEDMLCCSTCAIVKHRKCHNVVEIENIAKTKATDLTSLRRELLDIESKTKAYAQRLMNIRGKVTTDATEITNKIQEMQDKVNKMFENLKENVAKEIHSFQQQTLHDLDMKNDVWNNIITDVTGALSDVDSIRQQGTPAQQLIMAHHLKDQVMTLKEKTDKDIADMKDLHMSFDFHQSVKLPPENNVIPGKLTLKYVTTTIIMSSDRKNKQKDQKVKLTLLASIDLNQGDDDVEEPFYGGLDFLRDGRLVALDGCNKKCLVYNHNLKKEGSLLLPDVPCDVTVMNDDEVAVSSGPEIYFIKISKSSDLTISRTCKVTINCDSICMMTDDSFLVGCYENSQPIRVVSVGGEERALAINFPSKQYDVGDSACTYIRNCNKVVLTDRLAHTVYIYDIENNTRVEVKDEKIINEPCGVAVGSADCIFVCSELTNSIVQVSHTGKISSSHALDMEFPRSVCVSKDNKQLAVSNGSVGKKKLQLYNIELIKTIIIIILNISII